MPKNMSLYCGSLVDNAGASTGQVLGFMHMDEFGCVKTVNNYRQKATFYTQTGSFLYTVYEQYYNIFTSVIETFVHNFHSAYINNSEANKGVC